MFVLFFFFILKSENKKKKRNIYSLLHWGWGRSFPGPIPFGLIQTCHPSRINLQIEKSVCFKLHIFHQPTTFFFLIIPTVPLHWCKQKIEQPKLYITISVIIKLRLDCVPCSRIYICLFFFFFPTFPVGPVHCSRDVQTSFFNKIFIKNGSHDTIYIFKNYFATMFLIFSFQQNKQYPNGP